MNSGPRQSSLERENKKLRRILSMARSALVPFAGRVNDLDGSDMTTYPCHHGIKMQNGQMMGPEECGRCGRELFARRTIVQINGLIGDEP